MAQANDANLLCKPRKVLRAARRGEGSSAFVYEAASLFAQRHGANNAETIAALSGLAATGAAYPQT